MIFVKCPAAYCACQAQAICALQTLFVREFDMGLGCDYDRPWMKPEPLYKAIGSIIRSRRRRLEWPQKLLASRLRMSRATLANIETGRQRILVHHLYMFAEVLDMKLVDFLPPLNSGGSGGAALAELPIPADLKPEQKEQIARAIGPLQRTTSGPKERTDAKTPKAVHRSPR